MSDLFSFGQKWVDQFKRKEKKPKYSGKSKDLLLIIFYIKRPLFLHYMHSES